MSTLDRRAVPTPRFEPGLARRKLNGTIFYGACLLADRDPHPRPPAPARATSSSAGCRGSTCDFITGVPSRRPERGRHLAGPRRARSRSSVIVGRDRLPDRRRRRRSTSTEYARDSRVTRLLRTNIANLAGVPVDHLRHLRPGPLRARSWASGFTVLLGGPDADAAHPAGRHHRHHRGAARPCRRPSARAPTRSARPAGRWSAAPSCPPPAPGIMTGIILAHGPRHRRDGAAHPGRGVHAS